MNEFESDWISLSQSLVQNGWIQDGSSRWLPSSSWVRMNDFKSDWISLSQSFVQNGQMQDGRIKDGRIQDGCHHQFDSEWMSEWMMVECKMAEFKMAAIIKFWKSLSLSQCKSLSQSFVQNSWIQDGRIQDGCHHQVKWKWMSLSQIELVCLSQSWVS